MTRKAKRSDLGRALRNRARARTAPVPPAASSNRHTAIDEPHHLQSILEATDLEEVMQRVSLAENGVAGERRPGPVPSQVVVMVGREEGADVERKRELDQTVLRIPRRPTWNRGMTATELLERENESFLKWRRAIADVEEEVEGKGNGLWGVVTPFEKNLQVWRQLWRVVERADVVVQIVDARNPLLYYCEDLWRYVTREMGRSHLLVLNKSDLLSKEMISKWKAYFEKEKIDVLFFSAFNESVNEQAHDSRVIGAEELIKCLHQYERRAPQTRENQPLVVGMCGYPNVGKSSTINVLLETVAKAEEDEKIQQESTGSGPVSGTDSEETQSVTSESAATNKTSTFKHMKRVGVSSTPGKTKHFQTLVLTGSVTLCDCPGLVFPNFSSSKSELIISGVLSIDTMRGDHITPVNLIACRVPASVFAHVYGIRFEREQVKVTEDIEEDVVAEEGFVSGRRLLETHARARGFMTDHDRADTSRSARVLLKDYVNGRVIYAHAPPGEKYGEFGIGPAVHKRKGGLEYKREDEVFKKVERRVKKPTGNAVDGDAKGVEVKARISGQRKFGSTKVGNREFRRVERNYYPTVS